LEADEDLLKVAKQNDEAMIQETLNIIGQMVQKFDADNAFYQLAYRSVMQVESDHYAAINTMLKIDNQQYEAAEQCYYRALRQADKYS